MLCIYSTYNDSMLCNLITLSVPTFDQRSAPCGLSHARKSNEKSALFWLPSPALWICGSPYSVGNPCREKKKGSPGKCPLTASLGIIWTTHCTRWWARYSHNDFKSAVVCKLAVENGRILADLVANCRNVKDWCWRVEKLLRKVSLHRLLRLEQLGRQLRYNRAEKPTENNFYVRL